MRAALIALILALVAGPVLAQTIRPLEDFPVWRKMEGLWRGELSYYDGRGNYAIHPYEGLFEIEIDGAAYRQKNWMIYPPGSRQAGIVSRGLARPDEGVLLIVNTAGRAVDGVGTMVVDSIDHGFDSAEGGEITRVLDENVVVYHYISPKSGALQHLQMVNMGVEGRRIRSAQGFDPNPNVMDWATGTEAIDPKTGRPTPNPNFRQPRAFSAFRETRIPSDTREAVLAEMKARFNVRVVAFASPAEKGATALERTDVAITDCDRLADHPFDPRRVTGGVEREKVELARAIPACRAAVAAAPDSGRANYQLGRVLFYAGRPREAEPFLRRSAEAQDYPQAQFVFGLLHDTADGMPKDHCLAARLWRRAALQDHFYSQYQFPEAALTGRFDGCGVRLDRAEMLTFAKAARAKAAFTGLEDEIDAVIKRLE